MGVINRATGSTPSEVFLAKLADETFLDLWSYPNVFSRPGKELCDLLVVCGDDVIIFSDKSIDWPSGAVEVAWPRWYKRAISKSVDQIRGAARWIEANPDEIYLDGKCAERLPLELPPLERRRVHGVCVAFGAEEACSKHCGDDDGTFFIIPSLKGDKHIDFEAPFHMPFAIGDVDPSGPFVHVFNQATIEVVMRELDTISDFTSYLAARAELVRSERLLISPSEAEILANFLQTFRDNEHAFPHPSDFGAAPESQLSFLQGEYAHLVRSPEYARRVQANQQSYVWDRLIKTFTENVLGGTSHSIFDVPPEPRLAERALRIMARENRLARRALAASLVGAIERLDAGSEDRLCRTVLPEREGADPTMAYAFMVLTDAHSPDYDAYRNARASMLEVYCHSILFENRQLEHCVGIACNAHADKGGSEDLIALEQRNWSREDALELQQAREHFEIMLEPSKLQRLGLSMAEFPPDPEEAGKSRQQRRAEARARAKRRAV